MKNWILFCSLFLPVFFSACIGDDIIEDFVPPAIRIMNPVDTLGIGDTWQFEAKFTNNIGTAEDLPVEWSSSNTAVLSIDANGLAMAVSKGVALVSVKTTYRGAEVMDEWEVVVDETTVVSSTSRSGEIKTTSSYLLKGNFVMTEENGSVKISISADYMASTALPGLYIYLGNNRNSFVNALEIGKVAVFSGEHSYTVEGVGLNDFNYILYWCKPFNVKVGEGIVN